MNSLYNMNFMMTFLLAKDLPETRDKVLMAMTAGQSTNLLAPALLKVGPIDRITDLEQKNAALETENIRLRKELEECKGEPRRIKELEQQNAAVVSELASLREQLAENQKTVPKTKEISATLRKVRAKKTSQELKDDDGLLTEIYNLAGQTA